VGSPLVVKTTAKPLAEKIKPLINQSLQNIYVLGVPVLGGHR